MSVVSNGKVLAGEVEAETGKGGNCTFQSLASRCSIMGSSGSLISPASSSSVFLTLVAA